MERSANKHNTKQVHLHCVFVFFTREDALPLQTIFALFGMVLVINRRYTEGTIIKTCFNQTC